MAQKRRHTADRSENKITTAKQTGAGRGDQHIRAARQRAEHGNINDVDARYTRDASPAEKDRVRKCTRDLHVEGIIAPNHKVCPGIRATDYQCSDSSIQH